MRISCEICTDLFDEISSIVSTPCGHVFHSVCLLKWLNTSLTCPTCRGPVTRKNYVKLFFNLSSNESVSTAALENELETLKSRGKDKASEIESLKSKIKTLQTYVAAAENKLHEEQQKVHATSLEIANFKDRLKSCKNLETQIQHLTKENNTLIGELEHLENVRTIVTGCQQDTEKTLRDMQANLSPTRAYDAAKHLAKYCSVLKRELDRAINEKSLLGNEKTDIKKKLGIAKAALQKSEKDRKELKEQLNSKSLICDCVNMTNSSNNLPSHTSPLPNLIKKKEDELTPISVPIIDNKRKKMNIVVMDKVGKVSVPEIKPAIFSHVAMPIYTRPDEEESISRLGYNGLGGHDHTIFRRRHTMLITKPYKKNPKTSK